MTNAVSRVFFVDSEELILKQLEAIGEDVSETKEQVSEIKVEVAEIRAYQKTHYSTLNNHALRLHDLETALQGVKTKVTVNSFVIGLAGFVVGSLLVGAIGYFFKVV